MQRANLELFLAIHKKDFSTELIKYFKAVNGDVYSDYKYELRSSSGEGIDHFTGHAIRPHIPGPRDFLPTARHPAHVGTTPHACKRPPARGKEHV
jgi:hypothetical protein